ncbi:hypothetical protein GLOIN_2v1662422 [Rhizophagus clarus]|uniref:Uncharacterized protein n=1 Tax=Rhizophagus clarus TaxID=94130 RepID=A0A8H3KTP6_9GLOM|nr:hypothetical protein GLOIN_2v1662422 [Rhizophagus clarus]
MIDLKNIKQRYTNVSKDLSDLYENTFGVAGKFNFPAGFDVANTTIERWVSLISQKRSDKDTFEQDNGRVCDQKRSFQRQKNPMKMINERENNLTSLQRFIHGFIDRSRHKI